MIGPAGFMAAPQQRPKLREVVPWEFLASYQDVPAYRLLDCEVVEEVRHRDWLGGSTRWPGKHKHVFVWWRLADGHCVGWNENPYRGWSFPVIRG